MGEREDHLRARLRDMYPPGSPIGDDATSAGVRDTPDGVVLMTRFGSEDRLYGIPISVQDTSHEFYYTDYPAADDEEWLDSVDIGMGVYLSTGMRVMARRRLVDDYIELDPAQGWPGDKRFYSQAPPQDRFLAELAEVLEAEGFDTSPAMRALGSEGLVAWVQTYENNSTGTPWVGHAVVEWEPNLIGFGLTARLTHLEVHDEVPVTVTVNLAHLACHLAGEAGARIVLTDHPLPELSLVGFKPLNKVRPPVSPILDDVTSGRDPAAHPGDRVVDTSFLDADPEGMARLLAASIAQGSSRWGQNRDTAGRHIPTSHIGAWWHRVIHPRTGRPPRRYAG